MDEKLSIHSEIPAMGMRRMPVLPATETENSGVRETAGKCKNCVTNSDAEGWRGNHTRGRLWYTDKENAGGDGMTEECVRLDGHPLMLCTQGKGGTVIYWGTACGQEAMIREAASLLSERTPGLSWTLAAYGMPRWNHDYSPWPSPAVSVKAKPPVP